MDLQFAVLIHFALSHRRLQKAEIPRARTYKAMPWIGCRHPATRSVLPPSTRRVESPVAVTTTASRTRATATATATATTATAAVTTAVTVGTTETVGTVGPEVTVATAERRTIPFELPATGTVEPLQTVAVQAQVGGQLRRIAFKEGDEVKRGQVLFDGTDVTTMDDQRLGADLGRPRGMGEEQLAARDANFVVQRRDIDQIGRVNVDVDLGALERLGVGSGFG